jgi:hypothetical protein
MRTISILQALLTPVIACVTLYIAYRQWQDSHLRLKRENYDRCLTVYQEVVKMVQRVNAELRPELNELIAFVAATAEAPFLFHEEIPAYINDIFKHGVALNTANFVCKAGTETPPLRNPKEYMEAIKDIEVEGLWFMHQLSEARDKFKPYLHIAPKPWWKVW